MSERKKGEGGSMIKQKLPTIREPDIYCFNETLLDPFYFWENDTFPFLNCNIMQSTLA